MTVFYCTKCRADTTQSTPNRGEHPSWPASADGPRPRDTVRSLLRPASRTPTVSAGPRDTIVVHPDDAPALEPFVEGRNHQGCCGPTGTHGPNLTCPCGSRLATLAADCLGPCELRLDPVRVHAWNP